MRGSPLLDGLNTGEGQVKCKEATNFGTTYTFYSGSQTTVTTTNKGEEFVSATHSFERPIRVFGW